jgi:hypothetical protein
VNLLRLLFDGSPVVEEKVRLLESVIDMLEGRWDVHVPAGSFGLDEWSDEFLTRQRTIAIAKSIQHQDNKTLLFRKLGLTAVFPNRTPAQA